MKLYRLIKRLLEIRADADFYRESFSQDGEDLVLNSLFESFPPRSRFYVDIGAHHPKRFSNTYFFYKRGWHGLNVDATPGSMVAFRRDRPRDMNVEAAVSDREGKATLFIFNDAALNTFSRELAAERNGWNGFYIIRCIEVQTVTLNTLLLTYVEENQEIDFLSVDAEGFDLIILRSLNWSKYSPRIILIEDLAKSFLDLGRSPITTFLASRGYVLAGRTCRTSILILDDRG